MNANLTRKPIALVGLRCSGKTRVGQALAARLGRPFLDLDERTLAEGHKAGLAAASVGALLEAAGEARFRDLEAQALRQILEPGLAVVLATGGGAVERADARAWLRRAAHVVWLDAPLATLERRLAEDARSARPARPPLHGESVVLELPRVHARRAPLYRKAADSRIETGDDDVATLVERIVRALEPG